MPPKSREERLFGAACLKLTLEKAVGAAAEDIDFYQSTLSELDVSVGDVEAYLIEHREVVEAALESQGQPRQ